MAIDKPIRYLGILAITGLAGCAGEGERGGAGAPCYPNATCDEGLVCLSDRCVALPAADGSEAADAGPSDNGPPVADAAADLPLAALPWADCDTTNWPAGFPPPGPGVQCAEIEVPLDHDRPEQSSLSLRVARQRAASHPPQGAIFQLAGGPGGMSVAQSGLIPLYMPRLAQRFDLVYVDQRGTGGSGYLACPDGYPADKVGWQRCAEAHRATPLDRYLTADAARDLEAVRQRLGYGPIYLRGGSYGTQLALEYIRQFEQNVVAAVLDGVVTPDWDFFSATMRKTDRGLSRLIADCEADSDCLAVSPDLADDLAQRRLALRQSPRYILVGGQTYREDEETFLLDLKAMLEYAPWRYRLPRAVHRAVAGEHGLYNGLMSEVWGVTVSDFTGDPPARATPLRLAPLRRHGLPLRGAISYVAPALNIAINCAEALPNAPSIGALQNLAEQQQWGGFAAGYLLEMAEACASWPVQPLPAERRRPVTSTVKVLLLSGALDFVTPPEVADGALPHLPGGNHLLVPHATHSTMGVPCVAGIITDYFAAAGDLSGVDTKCLAGLTQPEPW